MLLVNFHTHEHIAIGTRREKTGYMFKNVTLLLTGYKTCTVELLYTSLLKEFWYNIRKNHKFC